MKMVQSTVLSIYPHHIPQKREALPNIQWHETFGSEAESTREHKDLVNQSKLKNI